MMARKSPMTMCAQPGNTKRGTVLLLKSFSLNIVGGAANFITNSVQLYNNGDVFDHAYVLSCSVLTLTLHFSFSTFGYSAKS